MKQKRMTKQRGQTAEEYLNKPSNNYCVFAGVDGCYKSCGRYNKVNCPHRYHSHKKVLHALKLKEQEVLSKISKERVKEACHILAKDDKALTEIRAEEWDDVFELEKEIRQRKNAMDGLCFQTLLNKLEEIKKCQKNK